MWEKDTFTLTMLRKAYKIERGFCIMYTGLKERLSFQS